MDKAMHHGGHTEQGSTQNAQLETLATRETHCDKCASKACQIHIKGVSTTRQICVGSGGKRDGLLWKTSLNSSQDCVSVLLPGEKKATVPVPEWTG